MNVISFFNRTIAYSFYTIFFLVPLIFAGNTSELFEFHKMWLTFGMTTVIAVAWFSKMIVEKKISIQRTPLDIPIALFLLSQIISTIFSLDQHVSWWGYYSRFNGGLLSSICYILLYYAFVSNLQIKQTFKVLSVSLVSGFIVALWGFPAHFGADPTCLVFRGTLDTSCWTEAFKPTVRIFSTLGQPAWLAAYLAFLLPLAIVGALNKAKSNVWFWSFVALSVLLYVCLIFTNTRAGFLAFVAADIVLWAGIFIKKMFPASLFLRYVVIFHALFLLCNILFGAPIANLKGFSYAEVSNRFASLIPQANAQTEQPQPSEAPDEASAAPQAPNITDSGNIRLHVWQGAIDAWKANPIFGTGVETFAFAYYKYRPAAHNLTSEWDFLYNKAHNEYLNYLTTTGIFGLGTYLAIIVFFLWTIGKKLIRKHEIPHREQLIMLALVAGYLSILITNFFGFSVVIMNLYLFLTPIFVFILGDMLNPEKTYSWSFGTQHKSGHIYINPYQWTAIFILAALGLYFIISLLRYWYADVAYALGNNYDKVGAYQEAYPELLNAVNTIGNEPVYKDEFSINLGTLAAALYMQKDATTGGQFAENAIALSNQVVENHPNNVVYWKNRVRLFYTLAQGDPEHQVQYMQAALEAIQRAHELAPTDAKISYNLGVLYGQNGMYEKAIEVLKQTIDLKPDYRDAYFALGLSYHTLAVDENEKVVNPEMQQKAIETYQYILKHITPDDKQVKDSLRLWGASAEE